MLDVPGPVLSVLSTLNQVVSDLNNYRNYYGNYDIVIVKDRI